MGGNYLNAGAINPAQYLQNMYASQAFIGGDDSAMGFGPSCGGGIDSLFSGNMMANPCLGMMGGGYGMGYGGMGYRYPGMEMQNMSLADAADYKEYLQSQQVDRDVRQQLKLKGAAFQASAGEDAISRRIMYLQDKIATNDQDNVSGEYQKLITTIKNTLGEGRITANDEQVRAYAEKLYAMKTGKSLINDIHENSDGALWAGFKKGLFANDALGLHFTSRTTAEENIARISGTPEDKRSKTNETLGKWLGWAATGLGVLVLARLFRRSPRAAAAATPAATATAPAAAATATAAIP